MIIPIFCMMLFPRILCLMNWLLYLLKLVAIFWISIVPLYIWSSKAELHHVCITFSQSTYILSLSGDDHHFLAAANPFYYLLASYLFSQYKPLFLLSNMFFLFWFLLHSLMISIQIYLNIHVFVALQIICTFEAIPELLNWTSCTTWSDNIYAHQ